jgi:lipid-binding SYLF domain-containing protein
MQGRLVLSIALALALAAAMAAQGTEEAARVAEAATVLEEIMAAPDKAIPSGVLEKAEAVAVFPGTIRGGFVIGAQRGKGILSVRDRKSGTWSAPAFLTITGGSFGAQIGAQAVDIVLVVMNERGLRNLIGNEFKIGADAAVAAGPVGRNAEASTDIQLRAEILSYSRSRGLFAGITLNGSAVRQDRDANQTFYGRRLTTRQIAYERLGGAPEPVAAWRDLLKRHAG